MGTLARRNHEGEVVNTWDAIEALLRPLVADDDVAQEVASAFYDVIWVPIDSTYQTYADAHGKLGCFALSWRGAGSMVAELRGREEHYLDWCWDATSEAVSPRVQDAMRSLGLRPVT